MALQRLYLALFNWVAFFCWKVLVARVLFIYLKTLKKSSYKQVYSAVKNPHFYAQAVLILEILNAAFFDVGEGGLRVSTILYVITSRLLVTWIMYYFPEIRTHFSVSSFIISWSIIESTRYSFNGIEHVFGFAPSWLVSLRYDTIFPLYLIANFNGSFLIISCIGEICEENNFLSTLFLYVGFLYADLSIASISNLWSYVLEQREKALSST